MTGPEHYQHAEVAQEAAAAIQANRQPGPEASAVEALLDALVHATLALAAAIGMGMAAAEPSSADERAWYEAAGTRTEVTP